MSDYVDNFDWGMQFEEELDETDWSKLYDEVMAGPYRAVWEDAGGLDGVGLGGEEEGVMQADGIQPVERTMAVPIMSDQSIATNPRCMFSPLSHQESGTLSPYEVPGSDRLITTTSATTITVDNGANLTCDFDGCSSGPFKRRGELTRHKKKHGTQHMFSCAAKDCARVGSRGFTRKDKLKDHTLAGHDDDTIFMCRRCSLRLPRDLMAVHDSKMIYQEENLGIGGHRTCPLPRCSFKIKADWGVVWDSKLDELVVHLKGKHELQHRNDFANLLRQRGYEAQTCGVVCPLCPSIGCFPKREDFHEHSMQMHFHGPICGRPLEWDKNHSATCTPNCYGRKPSERLSWCTFIPDEVKQHRRTILRVWPDFRRYPVWNDIKDCNKRSSTSQG